MNHFSRRSFLGSAATAVLSAAELNGGDPLPWDREAPLREGAAHTTIDTVLDERCPQPGHGRGLLISNPEIKASLWGPAHRITFSLLKTDVFDRRVGFAKTLTLKEIREGAFAPANKGVDDLPPGQQRPMYGCLVPEGGRRERYAYWRAYPFPCQKPVGQIIVGLDDLAGAAPAKAVQRCYDGLVRVEVSKDNARAKLEVLLSMRKNLVAVRGKFTGLTAPVWLRLYRHRDQGHQLYMSPDGLSFVAPFPRDSPPGTMERAVADYDYQADAAFNGPMEAPQSGQDGRYFWIRQRLPAEKTFPQGFEYVLMGVLAGPSQIETGDGQTGLGTPPYSLTAEPATPVPSAGLGAPTPARWYRLIREATGSAATARGERQLTAYVTVVTTIDAKDIVAEAKARLAAAEKAAFDGLVEENAAWYGEFYDRRENGRVFFGSSGREVSDHIPEAFQSWFCRHGGNCKTDARRYQQSADYANVEQDVQAWHGIPCYNEIFYTSHYVRNRGDAVDLWKYLVEQWWPAARQNVRDVFDMPGGAILHGYLPPIKPDRYIHTNSQLELCLDTAAQVVRPLWDEWDYGGDEKFLREKVYPVLKDLATFYAAYAHKGEDGRYHVVPSVQAEDWGVYPEFSRTRDTISSLCMFKWTFRRAAEAASLLRVDADSRKQWLEMASKMADYPTWDGPSGTIFAALRGIKPEKRPGDHPWFVGLYPTNLADEITLDSDPNLREMMARTAREVTTARNPDVLILLGECKETVANISKDPPVLRDVSALRDEVARSPERLLNSRSGRIHLFPSVPAWAVVGFRRFQARNGLLVSAFRDAQGVRHVEIEARRPAVCRIVCPWRQGNITVREGAAKVAFKMDESCITFNVRPGRVYLIGR
jgi:hypothetical protein